MRQRQPRVPSLSMDDNTRQVLTTLIQVGGGFMAGVLAAWLGFRWNHALEQERLDREDRRQRQERGYTERRDACIDLLTCVSELGALSLTQSPGLLVDPLEFAAMRRKAE
jgi:hypothetical protein